MPVLECDAAFVEHHASLAGYREKVFRSCCEIWCLVDGSRGAMAQSQQPIAQPEAALARGSGRSRAKPKLCEQLDFKYNANARFRLAECETHAGIRTVLMRMGYVGRRPLIRHRWEVAPPQ
jgi:hypothetical protein